MSNKEQVDLNINIQLQSLRAAFAELEKIQTKVRDIQTGNTSTLAPTNKQLQMSQQIDAERNAKISMINDVKAQAMAELESENAASLRNRERLANSIELERQKKINAINDVKSAATAEYNVDLERRQRIATQIDAERRAKIDAVKAVKAEVAKAAADEQKQWMNAVKQAFSLHIIQMYVQPFVNALNQLLRTTLTTFAEFDKYYADYLAKSMDFENVVSRGEIYSGGVNQVYSIQNMADAMERFSASGIDLTQNQQALTDVLELSVTAAISYDEAANAVIKTQEAFKLSIEDSTMIVDALTNAANSSTAELKDLTEWFGYASGMAHETGINVQQLAAYLGILSSTGMKSAGTAMRQMLVQMTDTNVREKLDAIFGQKFDYMQMDETLLKMREFVQNSSNQAEVMQRISNALGGKVNAREALSRLLTADDATWSRIMTATERSGTAAALFDTMTNNASGNLSKIKNNITIILTQIGEAFSPILSVLVVVTGWVATFINAMPTFSKYVIGGMIIFAGAVAAAISALVSLVGLFYMVFAANKMFAGGALQAEFSVMQLVKSLKVLSVTLFEHVTITTNAAKSTIQFGAANKYAASMTRNAKLGMLSGIGAMVSYMGYQYAMEQQAYSLATALNYVTSILAGVTVGAMVGGPVGALLGGAVGLGSAYMGQSNIDRAKEESTLSRRQSAWYGKNDVTQYNDTGAKNYFTINNMNLSGVQEPADLANLLSEESGYV